LSKSVAAKAHGRIASCRLDRCLGTHQLDLDDRLNAVALVYAFQRLDQPRSHKPCRETHGILRLSARAARHRNDWRRTPSRQDENSKPCAPQTPNCLSAKGVIAYAWADSTDPKRATIVDQGCEEAEKRGTPIIRDKATLSVGDSISKFVRAIGEGDRIFVILSDKYLKSPFCMFELFEIWRNSRKDKAEFLRRVRIFTLDDAKIWKPVDRIRYGKYWKDQHEKLRKAVD
jgi:hypothetical protein